MKEQLTILAKIFCRWLRWHWPVMSGHWHYKARVHTPCRLCHKIISTDENEKGWT